MWRWTIIFTATAIAVVVSSPHQEAFDKQLYKDVLDPGLCRQQLEHMRPFEFYDASFRMPQGLLTVNVNSLGEYHQCLRIRQQSAVGPIEGKYCMISVTNKETIKIPRFTGNSWPGFVGWTEFNTSWTAKDFMKSKGFRKISVIERFLVAYDKSKSVPVSLAFCIPKACSVGDFLEPEMNNSIVPITYSEQYCRLPNDKPLSGADYAAIVLLSILGLFTILSTGYDLHYTFILKQDTQNRNKLYSCCSVYTNTTRLFTFTSNPASVDCLDGIRSISIFWVIMGHLHNNYLLVTHAANLINFLEWFDKMEAIWLLSADASVDTFFTISGLLLVYTTVINKMTPRLLLLNIHWFYLYRLLRLFPLLALGVLLQASLFFRVTDGPNWWNLAQWQVNACRQYWWSALLHIQNWLNPNRLTMCLLQTWYLSVDMQLHILSPVVLYWVLGSRRSARTALTVALFAVLTINTAYCFLTDFSEHSFERYYINTLTRAPQFIIGMICGYILCIVRGRKAQIPMLVIATGYLLALLCSSYVMYQAYPEWSSAFVRNLNYSFGKSLWALSVCWLIFACVCGYAGPINWFLSLTLWKFLSRISYAMFIFHYPIIFMHEGSLTVPFYYSMENMWFTFAGVTAYTVLVSVAACVLVDAPCSTLQKLMIRRLAKGFAEPRNNSREQLKASDQKKQDGHVERGSTPESPE